MIVEICSEVVCSRLPTPHPRLICSNPTRKRGKDPRQAYANCRHDYLLRRLCHAVVLGSTIVTTIQDTAVNEISNTKGIESGRP